MNYIKHHKNVFALMVKDNDITSIDISVYNALFLFWNYSNFCETLSISRSEIMSLSKVGNANTYTKSLKRLHDKKYIVYNPSNNPLIGSKITMCRFDNSSGKSSDITTGKGGGYSTDKGGDTLYKQYKQLNKITIDKILSYFDSLSSDDLKVEISKLKKEDDTQKEKSFKELTKEEFYSELCTFIGSEFNKHTIRSFFDYWTEPNAKGKMKFQLENTWSTSRRLNTWKNNESKFGTIQPIKQQTKIPGPWDS